MHFKACTQPFDIETSVRYTFAPFPPIPSHRVAQHLLQHPNNWNQAAEQRGIISIQILHQSLIGINDILLRYHGTMYLKVRA